MSNQKKNNRKYVEDRIKVASNIFGTDLKTTEQKLWRSAISGLPVREYDYGLSKLDLKAVSRVDTDLMKIVLKQGRTFFGHRSEGKEYALYNQFKSIIPSKVNGDSYKLALDVQRRYIDNSLSRYMSRGGIFIEGGCYTGLKAMKWHDLCEGDCHIIAVEIGAANVEIMRMMLEANNISTIIPVHAGLWREDGEMEQKHSFTTRRFLEKTDRWEKWMRFSEKVETLSIDTLLNRQNVDVADYMNVQVNGAEIEVLRGFRDINRVKVIDIAAHYSKGNEKNIDVVREILVDRDYKIIHADKSTRIAAISPKWKGSIKAK